MITNRVTVKRIKNRNNDSINKRLKILEKNYIFLDKDIENLVETLELYTNSAGRRLPNRLDKLEILVDVLEQDVKNLQPIEYR